MRVFMNRWMRFERARSTGAFLRGGLGLVMGLAMLSLALPAGATSIQEFSKSGFVLYGADRVRMGAGSKTLNGAVGSEIQVKVASRGGIGGDVYSGGLVRVKRRVHVAGDVRAGSWVRLGHGSTFDGNIDAVEDVTVVRRASVLGTVTHPASSNLRNHGSVGGEVLGVPLAPILPGLPEATAFSAGGDSVFVRRGRNTVGLTPGSYDVLKIGTGNVLELTAGDYYFNSFTLRSGKIHFDVSDGAIHVFVQGDVKIGRGRDARVLGGEPGQVWFETHGDFKKPGGTWVGGVFAPFGTISFGNGSNPTYIETPGLWAREIDLKHRVTVRHNPVPEPDSRVLFGAGMLLLACAMLRSGLRGRSSIPAR